MTSSETRSAASPKLDAIQVLRALAAGLVVIGHVMGAVQVLSADAGVAFSRPPFPTGAGVDLFFVISGFIMVVASEKLFAKQGSARDFLWRRLIRIVPLYWAVTTLALGLLVIGGRRDMPGIDAVLSSYMFLPYDTTGRGDGFAFPIVDLGWTLNYEMLFYAIFALFIGQTRERCIGLTTALLLAIVALGVTFEPAGVPLRFWTQPIMLEFVGGMWLAQLYRQGRLQWSGAIRAALAIAAIALLLANPIQSLHVPTTPNGFDRLLGWGLPAAALFAAAVAGPLPLWSPLARGLVLIGDASYSLYMTHPFWLLVLHRLNERMPREWFDPWAAIIVGVVGAIVVSIAVHLAFERPVTRALTARLRSAGAPIRNVPLPGE